MDVIGRRVDGKGVAALSGRDGLQVREWFGSEDFHDPRFSHGHIKTVQPGVEPNYVGSPREIPAHASGPGRKVDHHQLSVVASAVKETPVGVLLETVRARGGNIKKPTNNSGVRAVDLRNARRVGNIHVERIGARVVKGPSSSPG
jgi:hypothetical protein